MEMTTTGYIDTHAHLYAAAFDEDRDDMMRRAIDAGVERIYLPNVDSSSIEVMLALETAWPGRAFAMMGLHPCSVGENFATELDMVRNWLDRREWVAIGEIGIDLYWDKSTLDWQREAFITQARWAGELGRPIVIHSRESIDILIDLVSELQDGRLRGVFHCFSGDAEQARRIAGLGFYMGIGGVLTYKKSTLPDVVAGIPLEWLVLETDAPYLPPTPHRGQRNESSYIPLIAARLAEAQGISIDEVAAATTRNALKLFA